VIVSAVRTPFGKLGGGLKHRAATELGAVVVRAAVERIGLEGSEVDYVIMGQVLQAGAGQAPARQAAVGAALPIEVPADTINKVCASSIRAVQIADSMIRAGDVEVVVTGGMESMSNAPYALPKGRFGYRMGDGVVVDLMIWDGLRSTFDEQHMVQQAARVARELGVSREEQDGWAFRSHERAARAQDEGFFAEEIVPVGEVSADESIRRDTTLEKLAGLRPVMDPEGTITAGNAPGVNDGASAVVVTSEERARELGVEPLARVVAQATSGIQPELVMMAPVEAIRKVLRKAGWSLSEVDLIELNEAFAVQAVAIIRELGLDPERVNVNGGAVALGHAIGQSGSRLLTTMLYEMKRRGARRGLAALCLGGGNAVALAVER